MECTVCCLLGKERTKFVGVRIKTGRGEGKQPMKTTKLTAILLAAAIILLLAVPQLRGTLDLLRYNPIGVHGTWLRKAEVEQVVNRHPQDPEMWLAFAECGASSDFPQRYWSPTYPWDQSWLPQPAYERAISLAPDSPAPYLRYAIYLLANSGELGRVEEAGVERAEEPQRTATQIANLREAESLLQEARRLQPDNAACDHLLAYIYLVQHKDEQAFAVLRRAIGKPRWNIGSQAAATAVLRLLGAAGSASPLLETHAFGIASSSGIHTTTKLRSLSHNLDGLGEQFRKGAQHQKAILCCEAAVQLGYVMRKDAYSVIDGLVSIAITKIAAASFLSEEERERIMQEVPVTADEGHHTEEIQTSLRAMHTFSKEPRGREMQRYLREGSKREAVKSAQQRKKEEGVRRQQDERMRRMEEARVDNFAAYMHSHGRSGLGEFYRQEIEAANQWKKQARAAIDSQVSSSVFLYGWPGYSRLLWLQTGLPLALWLLVGLISVVVRYWREPRAGLAWHWWQGLPLIGILLVGIRLLAPWPELHVYSYFYAYPIYLPAAICGLSLIIAAWLVVVLVVTLLKRARQAPAQRLGKARTYLATLRVLVPVTFAVLFLLSVISLWPARQSVQPWRDQTRAKIQQGEVRYLEIGATNPTNHEPSVPRY